MVHPLGRRIPLYERPDPDDESMVRRYIEERFREAGWFDKKKSPATITHIRSKTYDHGHHIILHVPVAGKDIPLEMIQLAGELEEELDKQGYSVAVILRQAFLPKSPS
jgi:hypothetical protein